MTKRADFEVVGQCSTNDGKEAMAAARAFAERLSSVSVAAPPVTPLNEVGAFNEVPVDLATLAAAGGRQLPFAHKGVRLIYRKMGSNPGGRIDFVSAGRITQLYPGCRVEAPFDGGTLVLGTGSSEVGTALFTVVKLEGYDFREPEVADVTQSQNIYLLGSLSAGGVITYVSVLEDTDPVGVAPAGAFQTNGFTGLVLLIDGLSNAGNATTFDLVPWFDPNRDGDWHEQGTERISVPDSDSSGFRYRVVALSIQNANGNMYFSIRNLLAAARTALGFAVLGVVQ